MICAVSIARGITLAINDVRLAAWNAGGDPAAPPLARDRAA